MLRLGNISENFYDPILENNGDGIGAAVLGSNAATWY